MIFENPGLLWLLLAIPVFLVVLGVWGWSRKRAVIAIFPSVYNSLWKKQLEKYVLAGVLIALLVMALALPKIAYTAPPREQMSGEIILLVDVSGSMGAQSEPYATTRIDRVKPILLDIIEKMDELGQVKIGLCGFTNTARSHVPLVGSEDYPYLEESVRRVIGVYSVAGSSTGFGQPIIDTLAKFSEDATSKTIIMVSDGDPFYWGASTVTEKEQQLIENAIVAAVEQEVAIISIGVGEKEGAKIPLYDSNGDFTGNYAQKEKGVDYIFYYRDDLLKDIAARTGGKYYFENNLTGLTEFIETQLDTVYMEEVHEEEELYRYVAHWFLFAAIPFWLVFARRHVLG
jgi:hypothetical protein